MKRTLPLAEPPRICQKSTMTLRPDDLGIKDRLRQGRRYLTPTWQNAYKSIRANTEGVNGRGKGHHIDIGDPMNRLAHGRVAQTLGFARPPAAPTRAHSGPPPPAPSATRRIGMIEAMRAGHAADGTGGGRRTCCDHPRRADRQS
ncbi:hypothetical protein [Streptosporangium sp. NPDC049644]|uniref:hypothetical protein n=1 Tax=Streptosporangium sp. NPDC049644 TaxID=3155507 RepID=UPI003436690F